MSYFFFCRCILRFKTPVIYQSIQSWLRKSLPPERLYSTQSWWLALTEHILNTTVPRASPRVKLWAHGRITAIDFINRTTTRGQRPGSAHFLDRGLACPLPFSSPDPSASGQGIWQASRQAGDPAEEVTGPDGPLRAERWLSSRPGSCSATSEVLSWREHAADPESSKHQPTAEYGWWIKNE